MFQESSTIFGRDEKFKYSNVAFSILGFVVEEVSGKSYDEYVTSYILKPLKMNSTKVSPSSKMPELSTGYKYRSPGHQRSVEPFLDLKAMASAGGIASTVEDLAKFISFQFRDLPAKDAQILKGSTIKEMHRVKWLENDWSFGRGFGWGVTRIDEQTRIAHNGYVFGYTSSISAAPADKFGVVVLTNAGDGSPGKFAKQAWQLVAPAVKRAAEIEEKPNIVNPSWTKYVGTYEWSDGSTSRLMLLNNELCFVFPESDSPMKDRLKLEFIKENTFKMIDKAQEGELIRFEMNDDGGVSRVIFPGYSAIKTK